MLSDQELLELSQEVAAGALARGWRLATAESCTGGWLAKCLTDIAGSSRWFERGFITYSNAAKTQQLGVDASILATHGAVSAETAAAMAGGCRGVSGADLAVAVTGIAGPDGGTTAKPVGLVWFGLAGRELTPHTEQHHFAGGREAVRRAAVALALSLTVRALGAPRP
jgi:nicotinamide-nucleotide amidase